MEGSHRHLQNSVDKLWWEEAPVWRDSGLVPPVWRGSRQQASFPETGPSRNSFTHSETSGRFEDVAQLPKAPFGAPTLCFMQPAPRSSPLHLPSSAPSHLRLVSEAWGPPAEAVALRWVVHPRVGVRPGGAGARPGL